MEPSFSPPGYREQERVSVCTVVAGDRGTQCSQAGKMQIGVAMVIRVPTMRLNSLETGTLEWTEPLTCVTVATLPPASRGNVSLKPAVDHDIFLPAICAK